MSQLVARRSVSWCSTWIGVAGLLILPQVQTKAAAADLATLFQEAKSTAAQLKIDAVTMESYTRMNLSRTSHAEQITKIKDHVNKAGSILSEMHAARDTAKPWHQEAIDEITPALKQLASNTENIINYMNANPNRLKAPEYQSYIKLNTELAGDLSSTISDAVDADNARTKLEELKAKLGA